jgi:hypothetical protein
VAGETDERAPHRLPTEATGERDPVTELARFYELLAESEFAGYCPMYEELARRMATDHELLARYADAAPRSGLIPILLFACVHYLALGEPDSALATVYEQDAIAEAWGPFRELLDTRHDELIELMGTWTVQTNEVGRSSGVLPALGVVQRRLGGPLGLVELGPSAGLNLFSNRFRVDYDRATAGTVATIGPVDSSVRLVCELLGAVDPPLPSAPLQIGSRQGIDLNPLDVADDDQCRWLRACVWPGLPDRAERLRAAIDLARLDPPSLQRGHILELVDATVRAVPDDQVPCLISTWVLAYLSKPDRLELKAALDAIGAERDLALITGEYPGVVAWLPEPAQLADIDDPRGASLLGITTWHDGEVEATSVAWVQSHGRWMQWLRGPVRERA